VETKYSLSVIVPVYNEVALVSPSTAVIDDFCAQHFRDYEVLIIESGSTDETGEKCDEVARERSHVRVIHEGARNGFGSAIRLGYRAATKDLILLTTLDLSFSLESTLVALPHLESCDYVVSYRSADTRKWTRKIQSFVYNMLITRLLGLEVRHVNSGFKLLRRSMVHDMPIESNGWFVDAEVLFRLQQAGFTFAEIPVALIDRVEGRSSVGAFAFLKVLAELVRFELKTVRRRHSSTSNR
jgi:glycosyltransferase involved in cell wall biosynthesis